MLRQRKRGPVTPGAGGGRRAGPFVQLDAADQAGRRSSAGMEGGGRGVLPAPKMNAPACSTKVSAFRAVHRLRTPPRIVGLFGPSVLAGVSLVAPYWIPCKCIPASAPPYPGFLPTWLPMYSPIAFLFLAAACTILWGKAPAFPFANRPNPITGRLFPFRISGVGCISTAGSPA